MTTEKEKVESTGLESLDKAMTMDIDIKLNLLEYSWLMEYMTKLHASNSQMYEETLQQIEREMDINVLSVLKESAQKLKATILAIESVYQKLVDGMSNTGLNEKELEEMIVNVKKDIMAKRKEIEEEESSIIT